MQEKTLIKYILLSIVLFTIINLILFFSQIDVSTINIKQTLVESPVFLYTLLVSALLLFIPLIWAFTYKPPRAIYQKFTTIDSDALDASPELKRTFYSMAIQYRAKYGKGKYTRYITKHFRFFYEFHNHALRWINTLCSETARHPVPQGFILSAIARGHIGKVLTNINYVSGLSAHAMREDDPVIFYNHGDVIEIWTYISDHPMCRIKKETAKVQNTHREHDYISAIFTGIDQTGKHRYKLEIRFLCKDPVSGKWDDFVAIDKLNELKEWIHACAQTEMEAPNEQGIIVVEHAVEDPAYISHSPVIQILKQMTGVPIRAFFDINQSTAFDKNSPIDIVILCQNMGIIAITEQHVDGDIIYSGDKTWRHSRNGETVEIDNVCIQATLARHTLSNILLHSKLKRWPIYSLVVYTSKNVTLKETAAQQHLQCPVIKLDQLSEWITRNTREENIQFTENDIQMLDSALNTHKERELSLE